MSTAVTYALEGRAVISAEFFDVIAGGGRQLAIQQMTAKIESITCTQHGEGAVVTEVGQSPKGFGFTISGCCDELIDRATTPRRTQSIHRSARGTLRRRLMLAAREFETRVMQGGHSWREVPEICAGRLERAFRPPRKLWLWPVYPKENA
jgi:hypothetical protein